MKQLTINKEDFKNTLVKMFFDWNNKDMHPYVLFISKMLEYSTNGMVNQREIRPIMKKELGISENNFRQTLLALTKDGHITHKVGTTLYLHPKYVAIVECDGVIALTTK